MNGKLEETTKEIIKQKIINKSGEIAKVLNQGDNVEIRKNPKGEVAILKVTKKNI